MMRHLLAAACALALLLPATAPARAADPGEDAGSGALKLEKTVYDFGVVEQNQEYAARVSLENSGKGRIRNIKTLADCGCYDASVSAAELAPGEAGAVTVRFRTLTFNGKVEKTLRLIYEDGGQGWKQCQAALKMTMKVYGGIVVHPGRLHFGDVLHGTRPHGEVKVVWYEGIGTPFEIKSIDVGGEAIETQVSPYQPVAPGAHSGQAGSGQAGSVPQGGGAQATRWKGWLIRFRFKEPPPRGVYSRKVTVHTTHPSLRHVRIPLTAHVVGKVWVQTQRLHLGLIPDGTTKSATVVLRQFDKSKPLGDITVRARKGVLQVRVEDTFTPPGPGPNDPPRPAKRVRVTVPGDTPVGPIDDEIEVKTGIPGEEIVVIQVRGRVFKRTGE